MSIDTAAPIRTTAPARLKRFREPRRPRAVRTASLRPPEVHASIRRIVDAAPALTDGQRERLAVVVGGDRR